MASRVALFEHPEIFSKKVRYDYLFELETWIKGLEAFLQVDNLPLSPEERGRIAIRNYVDEVAIARDTLVYVGRVTQKLLGEGKEDFASFIQYLERQINPGTLDSSRRELRLARAEMEIAEAVEKIEDFVRIFDELARSPYIGHATWVSAGRALIRNLRDDPNLGVFFREDLLPLFDSVDKRALSRIMERVGDRRSKRELGTLFIGLFKGLHYADVATATMARAASRRRTLVLFSRIWSLAHSLSDYIRTRLLEQEPETSGRSDVLERLLFSTEMELRKVLEGELVDVAHLKESRMAQERMENACGILRDLFQQNILALAEAYSGPVDARRIFPEHVTRRQQSLRLREELWSLVVACRGFQESPDRKRLDAFADELAAFRRGGMRYLMYKDWSAFDRFANGFARDCSTKTFLSAAHQFEIFAKTLIREIGKRQVLSDRPFAPRAMEKEEKEAP
ncbi:MAG TPA: hypothetical protein VG777_08105 [Thermoanaerobaculia bacterium]|nr:hypothetical protein [Thermoanaerobaculia bacterium]